MLVFSVERMFSWRFLLASSRGRGGTGWDGGVFVFTPEESKFDHYWYFQREVKFRKQFSQTFFYFFFVCVCSTQPWRGGDARVFVLQHQLGDWEDQPERRGAVRRWKGQALSLLCFMAQQLGNHRACEEGLLVGWLQLLWQVNHHTHIHTPLSSV